MQAWNVVIVVEGGNVPLFDNTKTPITVLGVARKFQPSDINLPGGKSDTSDLAPHHTVKRKLLEETGLRLRSYELVDAWTGLDGVPCLAYRALTWSGKPRSSSNGKTCWTSPESFIQESCKFEVCNGRVLRKLKIL